MSATCDVALFIGEHTQVDVQLPAHRPVGAVLLGVQRWLQVYLDESGSPDPLPDSTTGWRLRTPIGTLLDNTLSLADQQVLTGDPLELVAAPKGEEFRPRIENVSVAVARSSATLFAPISRGALRRALAGLSAGMALAAAVYVLVAAYTRPGWAQTGAALAGPAVLVAAAVVNARWKRSHAAADGCMAGLLLLAPPAAALLVPATSGAGPRVLVGAAVLTGLALIGLAGDRHTTFYTALATVAGLATVAEAPAVNSALPGPRILGVLIWLLVIVLSRVDLIAARLARLPIPAFPSGSNRFLGRASGSGARAGVLVALAAPPDPAVLLTQTLKANRVMTGLLVGLGVSGAAITALLVGVDPHSPAWLGLAAAIPVMFALRAFHFAGRTNVLAIVAGAYGAALALSAALAAHRGPWWGAAAAALPAALALAAPLVVPGADAPRSPLSRAARVVAENVLCLAIMVAPLILLRVPQMVYNRTWQQ